jgi:hypothetical protein
MASTTSKEDIASRAFAMLGANEVTDFSGGGSEDDIAQLLYEELVQAELGSYEWNFTKATVQLSRNAAAPTNADKWSASYRIDALAIEVRSVMIGSRAIEYEIQENNVLCDAGSADTVYMEYISRPDEGDWPPPFQTAMIFRLASVFAGPLARDADLIKAMNNLYELQIRKAKTMDSQAETSKSLRTTRLVSVRRNSSKRI